MCDLSQFMLVHIRKNRKSLRFLRLFFSIMNCSDEKTIMRSFISIVESSLIISIFQTTKVICFFARLSGNCCSKIKNKSTVTLNDQTVNDRCICLNSYYRKNVVLQNYWLNELLDDQPKQCTRTLSCGFVVALSKLLLKCQTKSFVE